MLCAGTTNNENTVLEAGHGILPEEELRFHTISGGCHGPTAKYINFESYARGMLRT